MNYATGTRTMFKSALLGIGIAAAVTTTAAAQPYYPYSYPGYGYYYTYPGYSYPTYSYPSYGYPYGYSAYYGWPRAEGERTCGLLSARKHDRRASPLPGRSAAREASTSGDRVAAENLYQ